MTDRIDFTVLSPIKVRGKRREPGDTVALGPDDLSEAQARALVKAGVLGDPFADEADDRPPPPTAADERAAAIREAAAGLPASEMTGDGRPKIAALEARLGWNTSRDEVTAALAADSTAD